MRKRFIHIGSIFLIALYCLACNKEVSIENNKGLAGTFTAQINGVQWAAADSTEGATILDGLINITGISTDNRQLSITLDDTVAGVYTLNQSSPSVAAYADIDSSGSLAFTTNAGSDTSKAGGIVTVISIDKVNKTISGTFSLKLYRDIDKKQKVITSGEFYKLPYTSSLPPASGTDTLPATIDGTAWKAQSVNAAALAGQLAITGSLLNGTQTIALAMPAGVTPGSYTLDYTIQTYIGLYNPSASTILPSSGGTLQILQNNTATGRINGNFQFQAVDPLTGNIAHQITNGYFSVQYQ